MAQDGSKRRSKSQDGLQDGPRYFKMGQDSLRHTSKRPQDSPKTDPSALRALHGALQDAKTLQTPRGNQGFWHSRLFASDGLWKPQDGPTIAQKSTKRGPRRLQDRTRGAQERSKTAPRRRLRASEGATGIRTPPPFEPWGPRWPQEASQPLPKALHPALFGPRWLRESPR